MTRMARAMLAVTTEMIPWADSIGERPSLSASRPIASFARSPRTAMRERREVWIGEENRAVPCPIYERDRLKPGNAFIGPAVVEQMDATTFIPPGMIVHVDVFSNLILEAA